MAARSRTCLVVLAMVFAIGTARAQPPAGAVALLPLDAEARLEIYGQPVASEIARALVAGSVDVVVVGPKMAVPPRARLIVDGTIAAGKHESIVLSIRVRNPTDGTVLETLSATASTLANIDRAAAEISGRILPIVRERLAAVRPGNGATPAPPDARPPPRPEPVRSKPVLLVAVAVAKQATARGEPLAAALRQAVTASMLEHRREPRPADPSTLVPALAPQTVATSGAERAFSFEVLSYSVTGKEVPLARARVRVRIADARAVTFDRIVVTDTVVGERRMPVGDVATRVAHEVMAILRPHLRRVVGSWP